MSRFQPILPSGGFSPGVVSSPRAAARSPGRAPERPSPPSPPTEGPAAPSEGIPPEVVAAQVAAAEAQVRAALAAEVATARAEAAKTSAMAVALMEQLEAERVAQAAEARALVGELVLETVRRLVGEQPVLRDKMLRQMLDEAAGHLLGEREVVLRVRPDQVALARGLVSDRVGWSVRDDPTITAGLRIEAARGTLEATLGTAMEGIAEAIEDWLEAAR